MLNRAQRWQFLGYGFLTLRDGLQDTTLSEGIALMGTLVGWCGSRGSLQVTSGV